MSFQRLGLALLASFSITGVFTPKVALAAPNQFLVASTPLLANSNQPQPNPTVNPLPEPTARQILQACAVNQADSLPSPFVDVTPQDWAYKAVLTMYYCGAYRGAVPVEQYQQFHQESSQP